MYVCILKGNQVYRAAIYSEGNGCVIFWDFVLYRGEMNDWEIYVFCFFKKKLYFHLLIFFHMQDAAHKMLSTGQCTPEDLCFSLQVCI